MDIHQHPDLLDRLAAAYALGTLRGGARRRFEALARERAPVRAAALVWQSRVASMTELETEVPPAPAVWTRIQNLVAAEPAPTPTGHTRPALRPKLGWWHNLVGWRVGAGVGALATVLAVVTAVGVRDRLEAQVSALQAQLSAQPQTAYVAVLNNEQAQAAVLVTFDPQNRQLTLQRVNSYQEAADKSLQLWALPAGQQPRSLGVLAPGRLLQLPANESDVRGVPVLAVSLEPQDGVPSETGPTGPVLFKGQLIPKML
jgi:anti-sigma-K factor RskA